MQGRVPSLKPTHEKMRGHGQTEDQKQQKPAYNNHNGRPEPAQNNGKKNACCDKNEREPDRIKKKSGKL
jgi:hypothetical protein